MRYLAILIFLTSFQPMLYAQEMSLSDFLERQSNASKMDNAVPLESIEIEVHIKEPDYALKGHYRADKSGKMRIDIYAGDKVVFTEALISWEDGWQQFGPGTEIKALSPEGLKALAKGIHSNLFSLTELQGLGYQLTFKGKTSINGVDYWALDITDPAGDLERWLFDTETYLQTASLEENALHPDMDPTIVPQISYYSDYRNMDGYMRAAKQRRLNLKTGELMQETTVLDATINPEIAPSTYSRP